MQAWNEFLDRLEQDLGKVIVDKWLRTLKIDHFDACNLYLSAQDHFHMFWFEEHVRQIAVKSLKNNNHRPIKLHLTCPGKESAPKRKKSIPSKIVHEEITFTIDSDPIDPNATFDTYLTSDENALPLQFLKALELGAFNPLYLCGDQSVGKSHLLMAICSKLREQRYRVHYASVETFTQHLISAIRLGHMDLFRRSYRSVDVLILDDVHLLSRRNATQEELFHTFNALHEENKQIILASHLPPSKLEEIEPRLISRFEWGLLLHLKPLSPEKRKELLISRAKHCHFPLAPSVTDFLLRSFTSLRSLLIAFDALVMRSDDKGTAISPENLLSDLIAADADKRLTPQIIVQAVATHFNLSKKDLLGKAQTKECSLPRHITMFLCRRELKMPFKQIGHLFKRDHSTVMSSIKLIENKIEKQEKEACIALSAVHASLEKTKLF